MCVAERDVGSLVAHAFRDGECRKSHVDEQAYVAVSQVVNSDSLYARSCTAALHLMSEVVLGGNEHAICGSNVGIAAEVFLNLLFDEHRDFDDPHGLRGLGVGDEVPAADSLIRCSNVHLELVEIEGAGGVSTRSSPTRTPVQYRISNMMKDLGFSSMASENFRYSSFVQKFILPASFAPIFMVLTAGFGWRP